MASLFRAVRKSPVALKDSSRHQKLGEGWGENKEAVSEGITFYLKYLGSTLVEEISDDESYGDGISAKAVHSIVLMAKNIGKKLKKVSLNVSHRGITIIDLETKEVNFELSIYRISFCTADKTHSNVCAFIARNTTNETMECHAFLCAKPKIAQAVTLSVSQAFALAQDRWEESQKLKASKSPSSKNQTGQQMSVGSTHTCTVTVAAPLPLPPAASSPKKDAMTVPKDNSPQTSPRKDSPREGWVKFDEDLDEGFSQLAANRSRPKLPSFSTDLRQEDLEDGVQQYMDGERCREEFSRQPSVEDLLNL